MSNQARLPVCESQLLQADLVLWTAGSQPATKDAGRKSPNQPGRLSLPFPLNNKVRACHCLSCPPTGQGLGLTGMLGRYGLQHLVIKPAHCTAVSALMAELHCAGCHGDR